MKFAVIGDLHLGKTTLDNKIPNFLDEQFKVLNKVLEDIKNNKLKDIILLGDVFDIPNPEMVIVTKFLNFIKSYKEFNLPGFAEIMTNIPRTCYNRSF